MTSYPSRFGGVTSSTMACWSLECACRLGECDGDGQEASETRCKRMGVARLVLAASFGPLYRGFGLRGFGGHLAGVSRAVHAAPAATPSRYASERPISGTRGGSPTPVGICSARTSRTIRSYPRAPGWIYFDTFSQRSFSVGTGRQHFVARATVRGRQGFICPEE